VRREETAGHSRGADRLEVAVGHAVELRQDLFARCGRRLPVDLLLAGGATVGDHRLDLGVLPRVEDLEGEILELPLHGMDSEPVGEWRVDLECLLGLLHLLLPAEVLDRAHVVQPVGELDQDHAHVLRHRHDHLAIVLRLRLLAALEADPGELGDTLDE